MKRRLLAALQPPTKLFRFSKPERDTHILKSYFTSFLFYIS